MKSTTKSNSHMTLLLADTIELYGAKRWQVSAYVGVTLSTLSKWECGESFPSVEQLYLMARFFGLEKMDSLVEYNQGK